MNAVSSFSGIASNSKKSLARGAAQSKFAILTPASLGFENGISLQRIIARAKERGLELCSQEQEKLVATALAINDRMGAFVVPLGEGQVVQFTRNAEGSMLDHRTVSDCTFFSGTTDFVFFHQ